MANIKKEKRNKYINFVGGGETTACYILTVRLFGHKDHMIVHR